MELITEMKKILTIEVEFTEDEFTALYGDMNSEDLQEYMANELDLDESFVKIKVKDIMPEMLN